jgi:hypothetical protein
MMTTSETSANGRGASFPGNGVSGNRDIGRWRTHRRAKLVHKPSATWSQNVGIAKGRGQPGVTCPETASWPSAPAGSLGQRGLAASKCHGSSLGIENQNRRPSKVMRRRPSVGPSTVFPVNTRLLDSRVNCTEPRSDRGALRDHAIGQTARRGEGRAGGAVGFGRPKQPALGP